MLQYYASALSIPPLIVVQGTMAEGSELGVLGQLLAERREGPVEIRASERGGKRRILDLAERNARLALDQEKLKSERRRQQRVDSLTRACRPRSAWTRCPCRIECFDISHVGGTHTVASMVVFEGGAPKKSDYRRFTIREVDTGDDFAAMAEVLSRRYAQFERQAERSPYDAERDASFAALPNLVIIDGGKGQLGAGLEPLQGFRDRGVAVVSLAKRIEEVFLPGNPVPVVMAHDTPELQLVQRVRDEAHRFAITHHRIRRDKAMTASIMDELPGHRAGAQARAAEALRLARGGAQRLSRGARERAGLPAEGRSRPLQPPQPDGALDGWQCSARRDGRAPHGLQPRGPRGHLGAQRRGQVERHERLRGRGLLLRRQPAGGDDPLAQRAVHARGLEGRAGRGRVRLARRRVPGRAGAA